jgi:hypothetical protein
LVKDDDADMMRDLARQDHVYACFRPQQDMFLEIYFSDPNDGVWRKDAHTMVRPGEAEVRYYKNGVASPGISFHSDGEWIYTLTGREGSNLSTFRAPNGDAAFAGMNIRIAGSRFEASQTYKNESNLNILHTLVLQLSTGRFTERYEVQVSGEAVNEYSGRCFVLPTAAN